MTNKKRLSAVVVEPAQWTQRNIARLRRAQRTTIFLRDLCETTASSALNLWKLTLALALAAGIAGCGTKTELLKPDGKPTPHNERDPSQPPSPISR